MRWVSWWIQKSGNDGRRPSGVSRTRSKVHCMDGEKTLCGRDVGPLATYYELKPDGVPCGRCERKSNGTVKIV